MGFSKQEYWNGLPFPPPRDLPDPGTEHVSPESSSLASGFLTTEPPGNFLIVVQSPSRVQLFVTPWTAAHQASLSITISPSLFKLMSIKSAMPPSLLILCHPLLLQPLIFPSIRVFSNESVLCIRWPKYWSFSFSLSPPKEHSGLISFRIDWFDLAVQGTLKSLLQHHGSKVSILRHSAFFMVQLSHPYMITGKTIALTIWTFVGKVMFLLFNISAVLVCHSFSSKEQTSFNFMTSVTICSDFRTQENKVCQFFHCFPTYLP